MEGTALLQLPEGMLVDRIHMTENGLVIEIAATSPASYCPLCSQPSSLSANFPAATLNARGKSSVFSVVIGYKNCTVGEVSMAYRSFHFSL